MYSSNSSVNPTPLARVDNQRDVHLRGGYHKLVYHHRLPPPAQNTGAQPYSSGQKTQTNRVTATAGSDVVQSGRPIFDDFYQHLWPYIGNNTANVVFQMVQRLWLIRIDQ
ncbi:hypothetical protein TNCV_1123351 [Trichonephila clavipes]|uniref:Uncharacterized protein n=1 Tax=Trichonephila clavipes TaxID=2585209 RepID=A0A8X6SG32_TRICX|nr:hypothetical protein TNCV_1123351 [Trichonephila clavipes]